MSSPHTQKPRVQIFYLREVGTPGHRARSGAILDLQREATPSHPSQLQTTQGGTPSTVPWEQGPGLSSETPQLAPTGRFWTPIGMTLLGSLWAVSRQLKGAPGGNDLLWESGWAGPTSQREETHLHTSPPHSPLQRCPHSPGSWWPSSQSGEGPCTLTLQPLSSQRQQRTHICKAKAALA